MNDGTKMAKAKVDTEMVEAIYKLYPKKAAPPKAKRAIAAALKKHSAQVICDGLGKMVAALDRQGIKRRLPNGQPHPLWHKVKYPQGYFNGEMFLMEPEDFLWFDATPRRHAAKKGKYDEFN